MSKIPSLEQLLQDTEILMLIENKINGEVAKAVVEKDKQIADLQTQVDELTATILMGGSTNV